jgi:nucleoside-diphosphate-sugar epimerase
MRALVTGALGFVGRHMTAELRNRGWSVQRVDTNTPHPAPRDDAHWHFRHATERYDLVVHCAAIEPHRAAIDGRPMHLAGNLMLDAAMFDWAVRTLQRRVLYLSSSAAYPTYLQGVGHHVRPLRENDICDGIDIVGEPDANYGWTKLTGERLAAAASAAGLAVHVVRPFSGYGEDQGEQWPFGAFIARAARRDDPFVIWGDGSQVRDWIHIDDVVRGALAVVNADERRPVNLCTGVGTSMAELVRLIRDEVGYSPSLELLADKPAGVAYRVGDPERMNEHYTAKVSIEEGVRRALA